MLDLAHVSRVPAQRRHKPGLVSAAAQEDPLRICSAIALACMCSQAQELDARQEDLDMSRAQTASLLEAQTQAEAAAKDAAQRVAELEGRIGALSSQLQATQQQVILMSLSINVPATCLGVDQSMRLLRTEMSSTWPACAAALQVPTSTGYISDALSSYILHVAGTWLPLLCHHDFTLAAPWPCMNSAFLQAHAAAGEVQALQQRLEAQGKAAEVDGSTRATDAAAVAQQLQHSERQLAEAQAALLTAQSEAAELRSKPDPPPAVADGSSSVDRLELAQLHQQLVSAVQQADAAVAVLASLRHEHAQQADASSTADSTAAVQLLAAQDEVSSLQQRLLQAEGQRADLASSLAAAKDQADPPADPDAASQQSATLEAAQAELDQLRGSLAEAEAQAQVRFMWHPSYRGQIVQLPEAAAVC